MIEITVEQLNAWLAFIALPLARTLALIASAPITTGPQFPVPAKIGLAAFVALLIAPLVSTPAGFDPGSLSGLLLLARETLLGFAMGLAMRVVFAGVTMAGDLIGLQMGLGFALFYDAQARGQTPVIGQFLNLLAMLMFLSLNGHLMLLATLAESFRAVPLDTAQVFPGDWMAVVQWGSTIMRTAVLLSLPLIAVLLIVNSALGVLSRAAPQLNVFAIGFPITIAVGFIMLVLALPYMVPALEKLFTEGFEAALRAASYPVR